MSNLVRRMYLTWLSTRKGVIVVSRAEAQFLGGIARLEALTQGISEMQRELRQQQKELAEAEGRFIQKQATVQATLEKLAEYQSERDRMIGKGSDRLLTGGTQCQLTSQQST